MKQFTFASSFIVYALVGCGGGTGGDRVDDFLGTWAYQAGSTSTIDCDNDQLDRTSPETGSFVVTEGSDADISVDDSDPNDPCAPIKLEVNGDVATALAGQTCTRTTSGTTITITDQTFRATLDDAMSMTITGTAKATFSGTVSASCTLTVTATAKKS